MQRAYGFYLFTFYFAHSILYHYNFCAKSVDIQMISLNFGLSHILWQCSLDGWFNIVAAILAKHNGHKWGLNPTL